MLIHGIRHDESVEHSKPNMNWNSSQVLGLSIPVLCGPGKKHSHKGLASVYKTDVCWFYTAYWMLPGVYIAI